MRTITPIAPIITLAVCVSLWPALAPGQTASQGGTHAGHGSHGGHGGGQSTPPTSTQSPTPTGTPASGEAPQDDHSRPQKAPRAELPAFIPPITDADRKAAFPDVRGHTVHDRATNYFVLFDQFEWQNGRSQPDLHWNTKGWVGKDRDRLWFRTEGEREDGELTDADGELLYGRAISRWWEVVGGVRQEFRPRPSATWAAIGIQGLAPYWFDIEATAYVGASGRTQFRFETEYQLLLTNRLILQPRIELQVYGKSDPERGLGAGLGQIEPGLRLRYEFRREFAPYVGVSWTQKFYGTADFARAAGEGTGATRLAVGVRFWL